MLNMRGLLYGGLWTAFAAALLALSGCGSDPEPTGVYIGTSLDREAPEFRLSDQHGVLVSLSQFKGSVVMLVFLDPACTDICPLTVLQLRQAVEALGGPGAGVTTLVINTNPEARSTGDVASAFRRWGVDSLERWHFLTGAAAELEPVWKAYGIDIAPKLGKPGEVQHTPGVFIIDQAGRTRWYVSGGVEVDDGTTAPLRDLLVRHLHDLLEPGHGPR